MTRPPSGRLADATRGSVLHPIPTALQSFVGGDLMSHPSWTISWDVLSTSISSFARGETGDQGGAVARSHARRAISRSQRRDNGILEKRARGTTDDGDDDALVVHLSIFGPDGATRRNRERTAVPSRTHTTDGRSFPSFLALLSSAASAPFRSRAHARGYRHAEERRATGHCGSRRGAQRRARTGPPCSRFVHSHFYHYPRRRGHACQDTTRTVPASAGRGGGGPSAMTAQ